MTQDIFTNDFQTNLAGNGGSITSAASVFNVASSPSILAASVSGTVYRALVDTQDGIPYANTELMTVTNMASNVWQVQRATESVPGGVQQGAPVAHGDGADVTLVVSAAALNSIPGTYAPLHSPITFGAKGDGVTNDTTAVQSFLNSLGAGVSGVIAGGTFLVDGGTLYVRNKSNFSIQGDRSGTLKVAPNRSGAGNNTTYAANNPMGDVLVIADSTDFEVSGFIVDGNRDTVTPLTILGWSATSGNNFVELALNASAPYQVNQCVSIFGGLFANGGTAATNVTGSDAAKNETQVIQSISVGGGAHGGDKITFTSTLANTYTAATGTLSDGFGSFAANGAYMTPYTLSNSGAATFTYAGRTLAGEDAGNGVHLLNCQRFDVHDMESRNTWYSPIKCGTGFTPSNASLGDACSDGTIHDNTCYHAYDQGVSVWLSQRVSVIGNTLDACGWAGVSLTHSDYCSVVGNKLGATYYRPPGDTNSGSGFCIEGGVGNAVEANVVTNVWSNAVRLDASPLSFGVNVNSPPSLNANLAIGTAPGTSVLVTSSAPYVVGATYSLIDQERTEKVGIASIVDGTHVTFDRVTRFAHSSGAYLTVAVTTDTTLLGNLFLYPQIGHSMLIQSQARALIRNNLIIGSSSLSTQASPFGVGVNLSEGNLHIGSATLGGEGSVIEGNEISATNNEGIYLNGCNRVIVRSNLISQPLAGSNCINETSGANNNRIENNIIDATATAKIAWVGAATQVRNNVGVNPFTVTSPAFPATTVTYTNTTGVDLYAHILNGTGAMTCTVNGSTGPAIPASAHQTLFIPAGGTFVPTYGSGTPTWVFQGN